MSSVSKSDDVTSGGGAGVLLRSSCHCGAVHFTARSFTPYPFMICHCSVDTKTTGAYCTNIMAQADTLHVDGADNISTYQAVRQAADGSSHRSEHKRHFCRHCASYLWAAHASWPQWIYPFSSAIDTDTPLPAVPPGDQIHIMTEFKLAHVGIPDGVPSENRFTGYAGVSIEDWHKQRGLYGKDIITSPIDK